ncbi:MAG TPA: hypothetical protein VJC13_03315 [Candidatus Paceibacterota bacterium]
MKTSNKVLGFFLCLAFFVPTLIFAASEVHITSDGKATVSQLKVMQIFGSTLATRMYWGSAYVRLTVKTGDKTKFYRGTGEVTTLSEITEGNILDITGELESGSDSLSLVASTVKNSSVQKQQTVISGVVTGVDLGNKRFSMKSSKYGVVTINASGGTVFTKGTRSLDIEHVKVGDMVTKASGDYDLSTKTMTATSVTTFIDPKTFVAKNYEGSLVEVGSATLPTTLKVKIGSLTYIVNLSAKASVLRKNRNAVGLNRFVAGDSVRLYGAIREVDDPIIDAEIIRNLSL